MSEKPNCYFCAHRMPVPGSCHSSCANHGARVTGNPVGIRRGWFAWPWDYDPLWLASCDGFRGIAEAAMEKRGAE